MLIVNCFKELDGALGKRRLWGTYHLSPAIRSYLICSLEQRDGLVAVAGSGAPLNLRNEDGNWLADDGTESCPIRFVPYETDCDARIRGIVDSEILRRSRVMIVGCGSIGSVAAVPLVRCGVGQMILVDNDVVEVPNLCRTEFSVHELGMNKARATAERAREINPLCEIEVIGRDIMDMKQEELEGIVRGCDAVLVLTDSPRCQMYVGHLALRVTPAIFAAVHPRGAGGDVFFTLPEDDDDQACYECIYSAVRAEEAVAGEWDYTKPGQLKAEPALGVDIMNVTVKAVKITLAILVRDTESDMRQVISQQRLLLVGNQVVKDWVTQYPFQCLWAEPEQDPECALYCTPETGQVPYCRVPSWIRRQQSCPSDASSRHSSRPA